MTLIWAPSTHGIQQVEPRSHFLTDPRAVSAADAVPATVSVESWAIAACALAQSASAANALKKSERRRLAMQQGCVVIRTVVSARVSFGTALRKRRSDIDRLSHIRQTL